MPLLELTNTNWDSKKNLTSTSFFSRKGKRWGHTLCVIILIQSHLLMSDENLISWSCQGYLKDLIATNSRYWQRIPKFRTNNGPKKLLRKLTLNYEQLRVGKVIWHLNQISEKWRLESQRFLSSFKVISQRRSMRLLSIWRITREIKLTGSTTSNNKRLQIEVSSTCFVIVAL